MKDKNELIYRIRQIIGEEKEDGFYTPVKYNDEIIQVPNYLFKDGPSEYPEIRISPFLSDTMKAHPIRVTTNGYHVKRKFYDAIFQIDIYSTNIVQVNNIYSAVRRRIDYFYDIDTVLYGYDKHFQLLDEERNIYYHKGYNINDYKIISIYFSNIPLLRVFDKKALKKRDTYFIDKTGLYVKDNITGIGTLSYIDPESNVYGALGHEINESNSKSFVLIKNGSIFRNYITGIDRSENGSPGSKTAKFYNNTIYGDIIKNTKYGIYGNYSKKYNLNDAVEIKKLNDINLGKAYIRTVTKGEDIKEYEINITKINKDSKLKSIAFEITDKELLNKAGGVVQGMSGSPIMQDGYLIGAVTHVLIDDVKSGYGVSIVTMLNEGDRIVN